MYGAKALGQAAREGGIGNSYTSFRSIQYSKNAFKTLYFTNQVTFDVLCPSRKPSTCRLVTEPTETPRKGHDYFEPDTFKMVCGRCPKEHTLRMMNRSALGEPA
jgi:hypothetical protein